MHFVRGKRQFDHLRSDGQNGRILLEVILVELVQENRLHPSLLARIPRPAGTVSRSISANANLLLKRSSSANFGWLSRMTRHVLRRPESHHTFDGANCRRTNGTLHTTDTKPRIIHPGPAMCIRKV